MCWAGASTNRGGGVRENVQEHEIRSKDAGGDEEKEQKEDAQRRGRAEAWGRVVASEGFGAHPRVARCFPASFRRSRD